MFAQTLDDGTLGLFHTLIYRHNLFPSLELPPQRLNLLLYTLAAEITQLCAGLLLAGGFTFDGRSLRCCLVFLGRAFL